jgi:hypothetical protein
MSCTCLDVCDIWSLYLIDEHRLRVFENRVLIIFEHKENEARGDCIKLYITRILIIYFLLILAFKD